MSGVGSRRHAFRAANPDTVETVSGAGTATRGFEADDAMPHESLTPLEKYTVAVALAHVVANVGNGNGVVDSIARKLELETELRRILENRDAR